MVDPSCEPAEEGASASILRVAVAVAVPLCR